MNASRRPACTVCIANYNGELLLPDCIASVRAQVGDISCEIIVHDDASTDRSVDLLRSEYPDIAVIASDVNVGFCISNNRMVERAQGEYILLLNNDAALFPDAIQALLAHSSEQPRRGILSLPQYDWNTGELVDRGCLLDPFYNPTPNLDPSRRDVAYVIGACLWIPRRLWNELEGFPTWMESIGEDLYLGCAAHLRGWPVQVLSTSGYRHRQGVSFGGNRIQSTGLQSTFRRRRLSEQNKTAALVICTPSFAVWPLLILHLAALGLEGSALALLKRDRTIWQKIYGPVITSTIARLPALYARRTALQLRREVTLLEYLSAFTFRHRKLLVLLRHGMPNLD